MTDSMKPIMYGYMLTHLAYDAKAEVYELV
jgi:hypothetical protein